MLFAERGFVLALAADDCSVVVARCFDIRVSLCHGVKKVTIGRKKGVHHRSVELIFGGCVMFEKENWEKYSVVFELTVQSIKLCSLPLHHIHIFIRIYVYVLRNNSLFHYINLVNINKHIFH